MEGSRTAIRGDTGPAELSSAFRQAGPFSGREALLEEDHGERVSEDSLSFSPLSIDAWEGSRWSTPIRRRVFPGRAADPETLGTSPLCLDIGGIMVDSLGRWWTTTRMPHVDMDPLRAETTRRGGVWDGR